MGDKIKNFLTEFGDKIQEQQWFIEAKQSWEGLDPEKRFYVIVGGLAGGIIVFLIMISSMVLSVGKLRNDVQSKRELISMIHTSNEELRRLKSSGMAITESEGAWPPYFEMKAQAVGIEKTSLTIGPEKANKPVDSSTESAIELNLKKVSIKQVVKLALEIENGTRPVKVRRLMINTNSDPEGWLDAAISVSAFSVKAN